MTREDHVQMANPEGINPWRLPFPPGWTVRHVRETGSTNADLDADLEAPDRTVLATDHQTSGRGRLDRTWTAPAGANLLVSILFTSVERDPGEMVRRVGLAALGAARDVAGVEASLKWPNDVLVGDRKLAGILAQRRQDGAVVVGTGLNVGWAPDGAAALGHEHHPADVLRSLLRHLDDFDRPEVDVHRAYVESLATLGRRVRVELPDGEILGTATGVEPDGRLIVLDDCALTHRVSAGDVVHLRTT